MGLETSKNKPSYPSNPSKPSNPSYPFYPSYPSYAKCENCGSLVLITKIDSFKNYINYKCEFCSKYIENYDIYNFMTRKYKGIFAKPAVDLIVMIVWIKRDIQNIISLI